jgi:transcription antitermination factor NusA-like protein
MRFPICQVCLKNEILCNGCAEKVGQAEIKADELKLYRRLNKLLGNQRSLKDVEIKRAVGKRTIIIVTRHEDISRLVGKGGSNVKKLAKELGVPLRIVAQPSDVRDFVTEVLFTVPILGINILYKPEGKIFRVRIPITHRTRLPVSSEVLANMSHSLFNTDIDVVFE